MICIIYVCVYVCIRVCTYVCVYYVYSIDGWIYVSTYLYVCIYMYVYMSLCRYLFIFTVHIICIHVSVSQRGWILRLNVNCRSIKFHQCLELPRMHAAERLQH